MLSFWLVFVCMMAHVVPRGHGGDGAGDPPPPYFGRGTHESDTVPAKKVRGKAKNIKLRQLVKAGGPVSLDFDREATYTPVGVKNDYFTREVGMYMWRTLPFDKMGWRNVDPSYKNAVYSHLRENFNLDEVEQDLEAANLKGGIEHVLMKRYTGRKHDAKNEFLKKGGYDNIEGARAHPPEDMPYDNWQKTIDHFLSEPYRARSLANKEVRQRQQYPNRGGTSTYSSTTFKNNWERIQTYHKTHTDEEGNFIDPVAEQRYLALLREFEEQSQPAGEEGGSSQPSRVVQVFNKVMGSRRGWNRGIGPKPHVTTPSTGFGDEQQSPQFSQEYISRLFNSPAFLTHLDQRILNKGKHVADQDDDEGDDDDSDDE